MLTKIKAAEAQIDTAILLFFESRDHLSAYTLAAAAREITDQLCEVDKDRIYQEELQKHGDPNKVRLHFWDEFKILVKPEHFKDAVRLVNKTKNFLKHADDDVAEIDDVDLKKLAFVIVFAIWNFYLLQRTWTPAMSKFFCWFSSANPHLVSYDGADDFMGIVKKMRNTFVDLYDIDVLRVFHEALRQNQKYANKKVDTDYSGKLEGV